MHIPDNYLSPQTCVALFAAATPVIALSIKKVELQIKEKKETIPMIGISASLAFIIMLFNVPVPGGTSAHAVGATLLALLIGPYAACISLTIVLLMQAFLFGDGGILALGANILNMAIIMPFVGYYCFKLFDHFNCKKAGAFIGAFVGINVAALMAGIELGIQPIIAHNASNQPMYSPYGLTITIPAMLFAHLAVAGWIEAGFTLAIYKFVLKVAPDELYMNQKTVEHYEYNITSFFKKLLIVMIILSPLGLLTKATAFGEWDAQELKSMLPNHLVPSGISHGFSFNALFSDYSVKGFSDISGYILSALTAVLIIFLISKIMRNHYHAK
ncbi:cobalt transporter CbiM [Apilactobacillus ozensis]|uniref:cobalt transporter CbiM n=1 Tax=Apilactobacillus ozensis TaxID=866801 RepID=UPI00200B04D2|nr:cobalt transporter CbiM [Apilactobacillus ozensis]MCK8607779.1 cobalt transporter CbiM [Apilactobacillus ozensis]